MTSVGTGRGDGGGADLAERENPLHRLTPEQIEQIGREFDALHEQVQDDLGDRDARYIRSMIKLQRALALGGRFILSASRWRVPWAVGGATLGLAKILENMEIGHNVMHGQWDWMNDPVINSSVWDWDTASTKEAWKHSHNYVHHTFTNILGKDRDLGYEIMRIDLHQPWNPIYLLQPFYNILLMLGFEWGVAFHDLDFTAIRARDKSMKQVVKELKGIAGKARTQITKDYIAWPVLSGLVMTMIDFAVFAAQAQAEARRTDPSARIKRAVRRLRPNARRSGNPVAQLSEPDSFRAAFHHTLTANFVSNVIRNVWAYAIIFCGHFPDQTYTFTEEETKDESTGERYVRQLIGAANIDGSPLFHVLSGNLGYQIEHHLYPDMPSTRYGEIAPKVRDICERFELPYNTGPFHTQLGMVQRSILRLALPGGQPRPKPGPYRGPAYRTEGEKELQAVAHQSGSDESDT